MFIIYENATKNDEPLHKLFDFGQNCVDKVVYNGRVEVDLCKVNIKVKKGGKVYATKHPISIHDLPKPKRLIK